MRRLSRRVQLVIATSALALCAAAVVAAPSFAQSGAANYVSEPSLHPPQLDIQVSHPGIAPGYFFVGSFENLALTHPQSGTAQQRVGQGGPLIVDSKGHAVWFKPVTNSYTLNLEPQTYLGKPVLTWWEGNLTSVGVVLSGTDFVYDNHYRQIAAITAQNGWVLSPHEALITPRGTILVTAYKDEPMDLSPYGGSSNGTITDSEVQEYDIKTGKLVFEWDPLAAGRVSPSESYTKPPPQGGWDAFHMNSIAEDSAGNLLVSMRSTYGVYYVNRATGAITWRLGGKKSDFTMGTHANFAWQHDARFLPNNEVSVFDDECCGFLPGGKTAPPVYEPASRGLILKLDTTAHTATMVQEYTHSGLVTGSQGNAQVLPNGNVVVGWGQQPFYSEYNAAGQLLYDVRWPDPDSSYRAFTGTWTGLPLTRPKVAALKSHGKITVYVSWNGATRVAAWRVLIGPNKRHMRVIRKHVKRSGFETAIRFRARGGAIQVIALDAHGHKLGRSKRIRPARSTPAATPLY